MRRAVFLDRDGVLNEAIVRDNRAFAPLSLDAFRLVENAGRQVARLRAAGLLTIVFTNQPEVARDLLDGATLDEMHRRLREVVPLDDVYVCPHDGTDPCACRKPAPGMLREAAERWSIDLGRSFVVGDRWRDVDAGRSVGCFSILLERSYSGCETADARVATLAEAVDLILGRLADGILDTGTLDMKANLKTRSLRERRR
jgi:D-glycero-D-manno-heptose 1,7-bisphosphate phosphatase